MVSNCVDYWDFCPKKLQVKKKKTEKLRAQVETENGWLCPVNCEKFVLFFLCITGPFIASGIQQFEHPFIPKLRLSDNTVLQWVLTLSEGWHHLSVCFHRLTVASAVSSWPPAMPHSQAPWRDLMWAGQKTVEDTISSLQIIT